MRLNGAANDFEQKSEIHLSGAPGCYPPNHQLEYINVNSDSVEENSSRGNLVPTETMYFDPNH